MAASKKTKKKSYTNRMVKLFMLTFGVVVCSNVYFRINDYRSLKAEETQLLAQIQNEEQKNVGLKADQEYYTSDAYIEQVAREQLGLIKPDERLFVNRAD